MPGKIDRIGMVFGKLTVLADVGLTKSGKVIWECRCECGCLTRVASNNLLYGKTRSCGCTRMVYGSSNRLFKHGLSGTSTYKSWAGMVQRCINPRNQSYVRYGGRGIRVCEIWSSSFESFLTDMGEKPTPDHQIDRIDNNGHYCPENCRWATISENSRNKRNSRWWYIDGNRYESSAHASSVTGINIKTLRSRFSSGVPGYKSVLKYN